MSFKIREEHWERLITFMEQYPELARGTFTGPNSREKLKKLWCELAERLNALGFGERTPDKWQKTWTDIKYLIKKKGAGIKKDHSCTGGGPPKEVPLNKFELRILNILGTSFLHGVGESEIGQRSQVRTQENVPFRASSAHCSTSTSTKRSFDQMIHVTEDMPVPSMISKEILFEETSIPSTSKKGTDDTLSQSYLSNKEKIMDHNYFKKKRTDGKLVEDAYEETIKVLKDIKNIIDTRLGEIRDEIKGLKEAIKER